MINIMKVFLKRFLINIKNYLRFLLSKSKKINTIPHKLINYEQIMREFPSKIEIESFCNYSIINIDNINVYSNIGIIIFKNKVLSAYKHRSLDHLNFHWKTGIMLNEKYYLNYKKAIIIAENNSKFNNLFHFLFSYMGKLEAVSKFNLDTNIVIINSVANNFQKQILETLFPEFDFVESKENQVIRIIKGIFIEIKNNNESRYTTKNFSDIIDFYFKKSSDIEDSCHPMERIYIDRNPSSKFRNIKNYKELILILNKYGFSVLDLVKLSIKDQIKLFRNTRAIIAPHGAGLTNVIYCRECSFVIEIIHKDRQKYMYEEICKVKNIDYYKIIDNTNTHKTDPDLKVDLIGLESILIEKLGEGG